MLRSSVDVLLCLFADIFGIHRYTPSRMQPLTANHSASAPSSSYIAHNPLKNPSYRGGLSASTSVVRNDPYAQRPSAVTAAPAAVAKPTGMFKWEVTFVQIHVLALGIRFKESPFFRIDQAVSSIVECPGKTLSNCRDTSTDKNWQNQRVLQIVGSRCWCLLLIRTRLQNLKHQGMFLGLYAHI